MSTISTLIAQARAFVTTLRSSIWAIDVRDGIGDAIQKLSEAIEQCYSDVSNPTLQTEALEAALQNKIDEGEMAALTIGDHTITTAKLAQGVIDNTLATSGAAADAAETGRQFGNIKADLGVQTGIFGKTTGYYINLTADPVDISNPSTSSTGLAYSIIDCSEGDKFVINAVGATSGRAWGFLDSSNHVLSMADANATVTDLELTAPTNAVKLVINDKGDGMSYKVGNNLATKASNGLSDEVKEAILDCFRNVYWFNGTDGKESYNALLEAFGMNDFYNKWQWDSDEGSIWAYLGSCDPNQSNTEQYPSRTSYNSVISTRRTIAATKGKAPYYVLNQSAVKSSFYPIPIPKTAGKYRISLAPDSTDYYVFVHVVKLYGSYYGDSIAEYKTTWTRCSSTNPVEKSLPDNPGDLFLICNVKLSSAGTSTPPDPSKVSITFLEE